SLRNASARRDYGAAERHAGGGRAPLPRRAGARHRARDATALRALSRRAGAPLHAGRATGEGSGTLGQCAVHVQGNGDVVLARAAREGRLTLSRPPLRTSQAPTDAQSAALNRSAT